jgi:hypothetical protein
VMLDKRHGLCFELPRRVSLAPDDCCQEYCGGGY